jgi:hypothetical protein
MALAVGTIRYLELKVGRLLLPVADLKARWKKKRKGELLTVSVKTPNGTEDKATLKDTSTVGMARLRGSTR